MKGMREDTRTMYNTDTGNDMMERRAYHAYKYTTVVTVLLFLHILYRYSPCCLRVEAVTDESVHFIQYGSVQGVVHGVKVQYCICS